MTTWLKMPLGDLGPGAGRFELDIALPVRTRLGGFAKLLVRHGQVEVRVGKLRVRLDGAAKQRHALARLASLEHDITKVVLCLGLARIDLERFSVELLGAICVMATKANIPEIRVGYGEPRIQPNSLQIQLFCLVHGARLFVELTGS